MDTFHRKQLLKKSVESFIPCKREAEHAGTVTELHPELAAEMEAVAAVAAAVGIAGVAGVAGIAAAGEAAAAPCRQEAAGTVLSQQPCAQWEELHLVVGNDL